MKLVIIFFTFIFVAGTLSDSSKSSAEEEVDLDRYNKYKIAVRGQELEQGVGAYYCPHCIEVFQKLQEKIKADSCIKIEEITAEVLQYCSTLPFEEIIAQCNNLVKKAGSNLLIVIAYCEPRDLCESIGACTPTAEANEEILSCSRLLNNVKV